jgi:hypothetical protein
VKRRRTGEGTHPTIKTTQLFRMAQSPKKSEELRDLFLGIALRRIYTHKKLFIRRFRRDLYQTGSPPESPSLPHKKILQVPRENTTTF